MGKNKEKKRIGFVIKFSTQNENIVSKPDLKLKGAFYRDMRMYPLYGGHLNYKMQYELMITLPEKLKRIDFSNVEIEIKEFRESI